VATNDFPDDGVSGIIADEIEEVPEKLKCRILDQEVVYFGKRETVDSRNCISIFGRFGE
jgi:hypothetical protein